MKKSQIHKIEKTKPAETTEKESIMREWQIIEKTAKNLAKTDHSNLSWRELLSRPHECSN